MIGFLGYPTFVGSTDISQFGTLGFMTNVSSSTQGGGGGGGGGAGGGNGLRFFPEGNTKRLFPTDINRGFPFT